MKKTAYLGSTLLLILALTIPILAQQGKPQFKSREEYDAYMLFFNEKSPPKKAELAEKFLSEYKDSELRLDTMTRLVQAYTQAQNWAKVMEAAERFAAAFPNATTELKVFVLSNAMTAAQQSNNFDKVVEYGEKVLAVAPDDLNAQITLSSMLPERLPQDEAGKKAALSKAYDLATRAMGQVQKVFSQPKPANFTDEQWKREQSNLEGQLHATLGLVHLNRAEYQKAIEEYETALKSTPREGVSHFRLGLAHQFQFQESGKQLVEAVNAENAARTSRADQPVIDELVAKRQAIEEDAKAKRDKAIDALATAVAIGGVVTQPAREQLERLWKVKNNDSLDGLDQFVAQKKSSL
jgi:tetratricopeptide (TPR) repeat protein